LLRIEAKQNLQWITHGTFEKRTVRKTSVISAQLK